MRIHTNTLTARDIYDAAERAGSAVRVEFTTHGSRSHARAFNVTLTGSSSRRPNSGGYGAGGDGDDYAATWDEWGMFLAELFRRDESATVGNVYYNAEHFRWSTGGRYDTLTPAYQHGGGGHHWSGSYPSASGHYYVAECTSCDAVRRYVRSDGVTNTREIWNAYISSEAMSA